MDKRSNGTQFIADKVENRFGRLFDEVDWISFLMGFKNDVVFGK